MTSPACTLEPHSATLFRAVATQAPCPDYGSTRRAKKNAVATCVSTAFDSCFDMRRMLNSRISFSNQSLIKDFWRSRREAKLRLQHRNFARMPTRMPTASLACRAHVASYREAHTVRHERPPCLLPTARHPAPSARRPRRQERGRSARRQGASHGSACHLPSPAATVCRCYRAWPAAAGLGAVAGLDQRSLQRASIRRSSASS